MDKDNAWKRDFPLFNIFSTYHKMVYLDNAATTQKPKVVTDYMNGFYQHNYANVHRGTYQLSVEATQAYEEARQLVATFIRANEAKECIFVHGTTEGINLVAHGLKSALGPSDTILVGEAEHHSNLVPWQLLAQLTGAQLVPIPVLASGDYCLESYQKLLKPSVKIIALAHVSNVTGAIHPIKSMIQQAHLHSIPVLIDGAQAVGHMKVDMQDLDCDYYAFSGHKMMGPTGIGVLYGKRSALERLEVFQGGGEMISTVSFEKSTYADIPFRFEAGTPAIVEAIGLGQSVKYLESCHFNDIQAHEQSLMSLLEHELSSLSFIKRIGNPKHRASIYSFVIEGIHPHDIASYLDSFNIAIRAGHHCAMPLMEKWGLAATARISLALYNTHDDIHQLIKALHTIREFFKR